MKILNRLTILLIDIFYRPLRLFYNQCTIDRAWLLQSFKGSKCTPSFCDTSEEVIQQMIDAYKYSPKEVSISAPYIIRILEPSYGAGAMLKKIDCYFKRSEIVGIELDPSLFAQVYMEYKRSGVFSKQNFITFYNSNFLAFKDKGYHVIFMNPPYANKSFVNHIMHALTLLRPGGCLITLAPESLFYSVSFKCVKLTAKLNREYDTSVSKVGNNVCNYPVPVCMIKVINSKKP